MCLEGSNVGLAGGELFHLIKGSPQVGATTLRSIKDILCNSVRDILFPSQSGNWIIDFDIHVQFISFLH